MKYRAKAATVDAVHVTFGTGGWPAWLDGALSLLPTPGPDGVGPSGAPISDGNVLVYEDGVVRRYTADDFDEKYERAHPRRDKEADE